MFPQITVVGEKPEMTCHHDAEHVVMTCSLPGSAKPHTVCNFYVGEARSPVGTQTIRDKVSASNKWFCQFYVQIADLLRDLRSVQKKVASCDYSLESEPNSVSARSEECSLTGIWEKESSRLQTIQTPTMSTAGGFGEAATSVPALEGSSDNKITENFETVMTEISTYTTPGLHGHQLTTSSYSFAVTPCNPASENQTWRLVAFTAVCLMTVSISLLGSALIYHQIRTEKQTMRWKADITDYYDHGGAVIQ
ncbi:uncharacterized protein LOC143005501 [Genypterus blacodes]|uniref:uncharacterized protein LOC143005501 n=1 Tax=Genypterus blacodes TaxID=154954 RepID=UPI003F773156